MKSNVVISFAHAARRLVSKDKYKHHAEHVNRYVIAWHNVCSTKELLKGTKVGT